MGDQKNLSEQIEATMKSHYKKWEGDRGSSGVEEGTITKVIQAHSKYGFMATMRLFRRKRPLIRYGVGLHKQETLLVDHELKSLVDVHIMHCPVCRAPDELWELPGVREAGAALFDFRKDDCEHSDEHKDKYQKAMITEGVARTDSMYIISDKETGDRILAAYQENVDLSVVEILGTSDRLIQIISPPGSVQWE